MGTTQSEIRSWLLKNAGKQYSHMVVFVDDFDHGDYPSYCPKGTDIKQFIADHLKTPMTRVMEVYSYYLPIEEQLKEQRAFNY